ncbi:MAG TPA: SRPBCC domain-containing protein [Solirubrobacteraceae bacterium]|nr:SRPBCC domain-containing protein [Solirubrobacteraceae bacterium]
MPCFHDSADSDAPAEEVWKLLYDPARFPDWWAGVGHVDVDVERDGAYTMYPEGYPEFPMAQLLETVRDQQRVTVSCLVSDLRFEWRLEALGGGERTRITVDVEIPEAEAARLEGQREAISASLGKLARLASLTVD